jgi:hypothetical protein
MASTPPGACACSWRRRGDEVARFPARREWIPRCLRRAVRLM